MKLKSIFELRTISKKHIFADQTGGVAQMVRAQDS